MAYNDVNDALGVLDRKIEVLNNLVTANDFMITCMREEATRLNQMDGEATRTMLRNRARQTFRPQGGQQPNAAVLAILEEALGNGHSAEVIQFPGAFKTA